MSKLSEFVKFFSQVRQEIYKISWADKKDVLTSVAFVFAAVLFFSVFCLLVDYAVHSVVNYLVSFRF